MRKVLLVDDEKDLAEALGESLSLGGYQVALAYDGAEALKMLATSTFDLVITDLRMPHVDGFSVLRWIMSHKPTTKALVMTAFGSPPVMHTARQLGALHCLNKPMGSDRLLETVRSVLGESGFSAIIQNITVTDYVQLSMYTGKTSVFEVTSGSRTGTIAVVDGTVTYAEQGDLKGERAFFEILSWEGGQISEKEANATPTPNVREGGQSLLLEALRLKDEAGRDRQPDAGLPGPVGPPLPGTASDFEHAAGPSPLPGADRGADADRHPVKADARGIAAAPSALDGLSETLNQDTQVAEYGIFEEQDFLRYKRSVTGVILHAAPSLYLKLADILKEELRCGALRYVLITTAGGARYVVFSYLKARGVVGLRPGASPEDFWKKLSRR